MGSQLVLTYRHDPTTARPHYVDHVSVRDVADSVRRQLGYEGKGAIPIEALLAIETVTVNGVSFELSWSVDHPLSDEQGNPVLGICEYDHQGLPGTVSLLANPVIADGRAALLLSTAGHELGHGIYDAPGWVHACQTMPLPGLLDDQPRQVYREVVPDERHLQGGGTRPSSGDFAEWRANEFMGSLLVPHIDLADRLEPQSRRVGLPLEEVAEPDFFGSGSKPMRRIPSNLSGSARRYVLPSLFRNLAREFGVTPRFIEVRLQRYGLLVDRDERAG